MMNFSLGIMTYCRPDPAYAVDLSLLQAAPRFHEQVLRVRPSEAIIEVSGYFCESWGNRARIDYGSGMELNFLCWLCVFIPYPSGSFV